MMFSAELPTEQLRKCLMLPVRTEKVTVAFLVLWMLPDNTAII